MYLTSLELTGFKSFAKKTELTFNTPITGIVGPNGSGKSNTAEAFRFVLGEQSIKSMRGKRTEDLIWNGSPEMGRSNRASVKLVFDNRKRLLNVDVDEVTIERVIYRDAGSEYLVNGSPVRLRDIVELLAGAHIGASGHHIISQGEADRILNANMRERREMIEDALGLKIFEWKREESSRKLEKTEENMKQVGSLRREIAPHLAFLKKQVEKVEKTKQLKGELQEIYREYLKREHTYITTAKEKMLIDEKAPKAELVDLEQKLSASKKILEETHGKDAKTKAVIAIEERLNGLRRERESISRDIGRLEGEISAAERMKIAQESTKVSEALIPISEVESIAKEIEASSLQMEPSALSRIFERIKKQIFGLLEKYRQKKNPTVEGFEREITILREKKKAAERKLFEIQQAEGLVVQDEKRLRLDIEREKDSSRDAEKEVFRIMARQNELNGIISTLRVRMTELEHLEGDFKRELTEGVLLVGREILEYEKTEIKDVHGATLDRKAMILEDRTVQEERRRKVEKLKIRIEDAGAGSGAEVIKEFEEATERDQFLTRELTDLEKSAEMLRDLITELEQKLDDEFRGGIDKINIEFQKYFSLMFGGGTARLAVAKPEKKVRRDVDGILDGGEEAAREALAAEADETAAGIDIEVNLPRKKVKALMMLSGGERALTSIALLFAMSQVKPPPFIILDETDAALDEANSKKYGDMVETLSKHSQLILITHNRETMSRAGVIYGVTMDKSGVSKLLSIAFDEAVAVAK